MYQLCGVYLYFNPAKGKHAGKKCFALYIWRVVTVSYRLVRAFFTRDTYPGFIFGYYSLKCVTPGFFELRILKF